MVSSWLGCWMAVIPPQILEPVTDDGLHHKSVFKVTNLVASLRLTPLDTWKRELPWETSKPVILVDLYLAYRACTFESAVAIPTLAALYEPGWGRGACRIILGAVAPINARASKACTHLQLCLLHSACGHYKWLTQQEAPIAAPTQKHTMTGSGFTFSNLYENASIWHANFGKHTLFCQSQKMTLQMSQGSSSKKKKRKTKVT